MKYILYSLNTVFNIMEIIEWNLKFYEEKDSHAYCVCINISFSPLKFRSEFPTPINTECENSVCCLYHTFILSVLQIGKADLFLLLFSSNYVLLIQPSCHCS